jgi:alpha-mannosidase
VEIEAGLDHRPLWEFQSRAEQLPLVVFGSGGKPLSFQAIETENSYMQDLPWRKRVLVPVKIPPLGWTTLRMGWRDKASSRPSKGRGKARRGAKARITNGRWSVERQGDALRIKRDGRNFFSAGKNLELRVVDDPWGSWGGLNEEEASFHLENVLENWRIDQSEVLETGPLRAKLWTRWKGKRSWVDLTFQVSDKSPYLLVEGRLLWNERSARLKLVLPCRGRMTYDVPGGKVSRTAEGQVPGGRWAVRSKSGKSVGFCSDVLSDFDATANELRVTLARATRYATDAVLASHEQLWKPVVDCGELKFQFAFLADADLADHASDALLHPPTPAIAPAIAGEWPRSGSLGRLEPDSMCLLSLEHSAQKQLKLRVQNRGAHPAQALFTLGDSQLELGTLGPQEIATFVLRQDRGGKWRINA